MDTCVPFDSGESEGPDEHAAGNTPSGKSTLLPTVSNPMLPDNNLLEVQLSMEYAELEAKAADAMQRAASAKKRALDALTNDVQVKGPGVKLCEFPNPESDSIVSERASGKQSECTGTGFPSHSVDDNVKTSHNQSTSRDVSLLERLLTRLELPKCELPKFDGSPARYVMFFRQFDEQIDRCVGDDSQRLTYLYHYCVGRAKEAIEGCLMYPPSEGYTRARRVLHDLFGQRHCIVRAMLDEVTKSGAVKSDSENLSTFANKVSTCADTLEQLGYTADLNSVATIERVLSKLPRFMMADWVRKTEDIYSLGREPVFRDLCDFVSSKARLSRNRYSYLLQDRVGHDGKFTSVNDVRPRKAFAIRSDHDNKCCIVCSGKHHLADCVDFKKLNLKNRWSYVLKNRLCFVCLGNGHQARFCRSNEKCGMDRCAEAHNQLLHQDKTEAVNLSCTDNTGNGVCLGFLPVRINGLGANTVVYAMLDSGSDTSLISQSLVDKLGVVGRTSELKIATALGVKRHSCQEVSVTITSMDGNETIDISKAYTVPKVLPTKVQIPSKERLASWKHLSGIHFDVTNSVGVDLLLGLDVPEAHWVLEQRRGRKKEPHADRTPLGWVLRGPVDMKDSVYRKTFALCAEDDIQVNLQKLYDYEFADVHSSKRAWSKDDERAILMAEQSLKLTGGHFCIGLPWKCNREDVCSDNTVALRRLRALKNRFRGNPDMKVKYETVIQRYIDRGFATPVIEAKSKTSVGPKWYLPHHSVVNEMKPDKVRVVFDCAARCQNTSLNQHLLQGPNMIQSLLGVIIRFRQYPIAIAADIEDMFLQVKVPDVDQGALRFMWWPHGNIELEAKEYQLTVHPFGAISSPFCANFALRKTASLYGSEFPPTVSQAVLKNFYVDDCLTSIKSSEEATVLINGLDSLLARCGFRLTKWISNSRAVLKEIAENERANSVKDLSMLELPTEKALGMMWDVENDVILFRVNLKSTPNTKRGVLAQLASLYDPLGLVCPWLLSAKLIFQTLCKRGHGWDEPIEENELELWNNWKSDILNLASMSIPRCYAIDSQYKGIELHLFSDASEQGYGAVAYLRFVSEIRSHCIIVMAKSRVTPIKPVTIPRLELAAAVVAADMFSTINDELDLKIDSVRFWTDSTIVLYYLHNETTRYATYVANRVSRILNKTSVSQWSHIEGDQNPADLASRGMSFKGKDIDLWFQGPLFLREPNRVNIKQFEFDEVPSFLPEMKKTAHVYTMSNESWYETLFSRFSCWIKLLKCVTWLVRFKQYLLVLKGGIRSISLRVGPVKVDELRWSTKDVIRLVQLSSFPAELSLLEESPSNIKRNECNRLRKLSPFFIDGLLCVGGRLQWSNWTEAAKHPIILPNKHNVTDLIIKYYHELEGHVGATQVLSAVRKRYWVLQGGSAVRRVISKCLMCRRRLSRACTQVMSPLPAVRLNPSGFAFDAVGVDYFGPLYVKRGRIEEKRYGCLFTCLNVRAVHIEVAHSMNTDSFIQTLTRFIARRGQPRIIYSDNGSNFKGADRELKYCLQQWYQPRIHEYLLSREIEWNFSPPEASHWGGVWERLIRSVKNIFGVIVHGQRLTDENLCTFLCEAERILNNRPLIAVDDDVNSLEVLTPSKFLLLKDNTAFSDELAFPKQCVRTWRKIQLLSDTFWKRWKMEYLPTLQLRQKWHLGDRNLKVADVVIIRKENAPRSQWPLGRVIDVVEGSDRKIREVVVKTATGILKRDVRSLCLLEGVNE